MRPLDAVRGLAVAAVLLRHAHPGLFGGGGFVGVETFFILSGYLITSIVARQLAGDRFAFRRFYRNRALRLVPALVIVVATLAIWQAADGRETASLAGGVAVALLYVTDFATALHLPELRYSSHLWTLAIEEQFYIVWPAALYAVWRRTGNMRVAALVALTLAAAAWLASSIVFDKPEPAYTLPSTWTVTLIVGCCLGLGAIRAPAARVAAWAATAILAGLLFVPHAKYHTDRYLWMIPVIAVCGSVLIANATSESPIALLRFGALQSLGVISYATYLWDPPAIVVVGGWWALVVAPAVAYVSYRAVELRFLRMKT